MDILKLSIFEFTNKELKTKKIKKLLLHVKAKNKSINIFIVGSLCRTEKRELFKDNIRKVVVFDVSNMETKVLL